MNRLVLSFVALAFIANAFGVNTRIVNPDYTSGGLTFSVAEIELTDTATILTVDIYARKGHTVNLSPDSYLLGEVTGERYPLIGTQGIKPGEKLAFNDTTHVGAVLSFKPIATADSVISFIEPDGWNVRGLNLHGGHKGSMVTHVSGTVDDYPDCTWIVSLEAGKDFRVNKSILVPVRDGKFSFDIYSDTPIVYEFSPGIELVSGSWTTDIFFCDGGDVVVNVNRDSCSIVESDGFTADLQTLKRSKNNILNSKVRQSPEYRRFLQMVDSIGEDAWNQPEVKRLNEELLNLSNKAQEEWLDSIAPLRSLPALFMLANNVMNGSKLMGKSLDAFSRNFADTLMEHPYHRMLSEIVKAGQAVPGNKFIDFTAPDLDGCNKTLSELIDGKIAVIDLWASWCGPCRRHSISMIPLYEKYRDRGFEIVGVARENGSTDAMRRAISADGYQWINLVELNDRAGIWNKYGAGNAGGTVILVGRDGVILEVDPDASRIEEILRQELGE